MTLILSIAIGCAIGALGVSWLFVKMREIRILPRDKPMVRPTSAKDVRRKIREARREL